MTTSLPKVISTGLTGLVGSRVSELLADKYNFVDISLDSGVNILDQAELSRFVANHTDAICLLHLAAFTDTNSAWDQRGDQSGPCYQVNVVGTQNVLQVCQDHHFPLIHISTDFVFDGTKSGPYIETDIPRPIEWYGETKYLAEKLIQDSGHPSSILRIAYPYRAKFEPKVDIVRKFIAKFNQNEPLTLFTDQITTPTFIDDIVSGFDYFISHPQTGIFHLTASSSQSPYQLGLAIAGEFGFDQSLVRPSSLAGFRLSQPPGSRPWQMNLAVDNSKARQLGITLSSLTQGLAKLKSQL